MRTPPVRRFLRPFLVCRKTASALLAIVLLTLPVVSINGIEGPFMGSLHQFSGVSTTNSISLYGSWSADAMAGSWLVTVSPSIAIVGVATDFTVIVTNDGVNCAGDSIGSFSFTLPSVLTVSEASVVSMPSGKSWAAAYSANTVGANGAFMPTHKMCPSESVTLTFTATANSATSESWGAGAWNGNNYASGPFLNPSNGFPAAVVSGVVEQGTEGDVAAGPTGDGQLLSNDVITVRRMAVGLITADPAFNEFQRADSAPAGSKGDGLLTTGDVIQSRRFAAGIDLPAAAGGPLAPVEAAPPPAMLAGVESPRSVRLVSTNAVAGLKVTVPVEMKTVGDEIAVCFTLEYDAMKLKKPTVSLANTAPLDTVLTVNDTKSGRLTILVDSGTPFAQSGGQLMNLTFDVSATAPAGETPITFKSGSISDSEANELYAVYGSGTLAINGTVSEGVRMSGRVLTPRGRGLRNAQVTISGPNGYTSTVVTGSLGYYSFNNVPTGGSYAIVVRSKQYRFESSTVDASVNLADLNFLARE